MLSFRACLGLVFSAALLLSGRTVHGEQAPSGLYVDVRESEDPGSPVVERWKLYGSSHALVIGNDNYRGGWPRLSNAIRDARLVAAALEAQGFEVELLTDLTGDELRERFRRFLAITGADPDARLFIWFAGHGHSEAGEGYLVPVDAPPPEDPEFRLKALHMGDVGSMVRLARAKHVLAVFDSCFAGTVFSSQRSRPPAAITRAAVQPVRQFLTSGDADQQVSDDGTFRELFLRALAGEEGADANRDGYLTGSELGLYLENRVTNLTRARQTPRSGKLRDPRYDRGDFVFLLPRAPVAAGPGPAPATSAEGSADQLFWSSIKDSGDPADYRDYLAQFPEGTFAALARRRLAAANTPRQAAPPAEGVRRDPDLARLLVGHAVATRRELSELEAEEGLYWWYVLHRKGGEELLERSVLLGLEALRRDPSAEAERALRDGLALLTCPRRRLRHGRSVAAVAFAPDGARLASAGSDGTVRLWELESGRETMRLDLGDAVRALAFSPDGAELATGSSDGMTRLWDLADGRELALLRHDGPVQAILFRSDGRHLVTLAGGTVRVWSLSDGGGNAVVLDQDAAVQSVAVGPDGTYLAMATADGARVRRLPGGEAVARVAPGQRLSVVAFSPDGARLAVGRQRIGLWSIADGVEVLAFAGGHGDSLRTLAFGRDGVSLASGGQDATARVWDVGSGREIARMAFPGAVDSVAFSPDGRTLATAGAGAFVDLWDLRPVDLVATACGCLSRDLTPDEWRRYLGDEPYRPACATASRQ